MDGQLTSDEFCVAMHLVDMAKSGQLLPQKLPPELVPPSFRRGRSGSASMPVAASVPQGSVPAPLPPPAAVSSVAATLPSEFEFFFFSQYNKSLQFHFIHYDLYSFIVYASLVALLFSHTM